MQINKYTYVCVGDVPASRGNIFPRDVLVVASLRVSKYVLFACNTIVLQYCRLILLTACLFSCRQDRTGQDKRMDVCTTAGEVSRCARTIFSVCL